MVMGRKSRRNRSIARGPPRPKPTPMARQVVAELLVNAKIERMIQAEILEDLKARYHPADVPVRELVGLRARRLRGVCRI